jgi:hypothetical protein
LRFNNHKRWEILSMFKKHSAFLSAAIVALINSQAIAQDAGASQPQEILVFGSDFSLQGTPVSATEGIVYQQQLQLRPVSRPAELLEFVPGLIAT